MDLTDTTIMDGLAMERMLLAIEDSLKITRRVQFFLWSQGALQGILPHDMLLCVFGDFATAHFKYDVFSQVKVDQKVIDQLTDPVNGLLQRIIDNWVAARRAPCVYSVGKTHVLDSFQTDLRSYGFEHAVAHGAREIHGSEGSFFVLFHHAREPGPREAYLLDLVMPHLHMALYRMLPNERDGGAIEISPESILSTREMEVLRWVREGKTNQEIGHLLDISPLTVKNHVQKILRKLKVSNRAQAVARGQSTHLFGPYHAAGMLSSALPD